MSGASSYYGKSIIETTFTGLITKAPSAIALLRLIVHLPERSVAAHGPQIGVNHLPHQITKTNFMMPTETLPSFAWIPKQGIGFGRAKIARIDLNQHAPVTYVDAFFIQARATPFDRPADMGKCGFHEFPNRMIFAGCQDVIVWLRLLQNQPHTFHVISRVAPVAPSGEIAEK